MNQQALYELVARMGSGDEPCSCRVIARRRLPDPESGLDIEWLTDVSSHQDLDGFLRTSLAVVFDQLEHMTADGARHLLAQLRDRYADRVIVVDAMKVFTAGDFLALGFERAEDETVGRAFVYDPDSTSRQREWNNADHWANPENFNKYRW